MLCVTVLEAHTGYTAQGFPGFCGGVLCVCGGYCLRGDRQERNLSHICLKGRKCCVIPSHAGCCPIATFGN